MASKPQPLVTRIPLTQARHNLGAVIKRVHLKGEYFILERDGIPVAGLMDADELEDYLELRDPKVQEEIRKSSADVHAGRTRSVQDLLTELGQTPKRRPRAKRRQKE